MYQVQQTHVNLTFSRNCTLFSLSSFQIKFFLESTPNNGLLGWTSDICAKQSKICKLTKYPSHVFNAILLSKAPLKWCSNAKYSLPKSEDMIIPSFNLVWDWISAIYECVRIFYIYILKGPFLITFWIEGFDWIIWPLGLDSEGLAY